MNVLLNCVDFRRYNPGNGPNPRSEHGIRFQVFDLQSQPEPQTRILPVSGFTGLHCGHQTEIQLPEPASIVEVTVLADARLGNVEAFNNLGVSLDNAVMIGPPKLPETLRLIGNGITRVSVFAPQNEMLLLEACTLLCLTKGGSCCCCPSVEDTEVIGLVINLKTMNENLDIRTSVFADVYQGNDLLAQDIRIATGEVEEWQDHAPAPIPFVRSVTNPTGLAIELRHPGIANNADPHWRMSFTLEALTTRGQRRLCLFTLQSSPIYVIDQGGQLNFEGGNRNSGRIPFLIDY